jgi:hypothetical protein
VDDFDRDAPRRSTDSYRRRRSERDDPAPPDTIRRRPAPSEGLNDARPQSDRQRRPEDRPEREGRIRRRETAPIDERAAPRERYSDRFRRQSAYTDEEPNDRSYRSARDPYDRLRRVGNRPARRVETELDQDAELDQYAEEEFALPVSRQRGGRRPARTQSPRFDQQRIRDVGALISNPAPEMRPLVLGAIASIASLLLLSVLILVRSSSIGTWIPLHLDAEGAVTAYGSKAAIWRLPFFALFATIMAFGLGWWLRARESYAVQYLAVGALMVHLLIWVGVVNLLW